MNYNAFANNANRKLNDPVTIGINTENTAVLAIGKTYAFYKEIDGKKEKLTYIQIKELAYMVFECNLFVFDKTYNEGHTGIRLGFESGNTILLDGEFTGEQYELKITSAIYDIDQLGKVFSNNVLGFTSIDIIENIDLKSRILKKINDVFNGIIKP